MHKWIHIGYVEGDLDKGCPLFECHKCGLQMVSYISNLMDAAVGLYKANPMLRKCVKKKPKG